MKAPEREGYWLPTWVSRLGLGILTATTTALLGILLYVGEQKLNKIEDSGEANLKATNALQLEFAKFSTEYRDFEDRIQALESWRAAHEQGRAERNRRWDAMAADYESCEKK